MSKKKALKNQGVEFREDILYGGGPGEISNPACWNCKNTGVAAW